MKTNSSTPQYLTATRKKLVSGYSGFDYANMLHLAETYVENKLAEEIPVSTKMPFDVSTLCCIFRGFQCLHLQACWGIGKVRASFVLPTFGYDTGSSVADEITGDVLDTLMSFTDFNEFKELALSHKEQGAIECKL